MDFTTNNLRYFLQRRTVAERIILINTAVFLLVHIIALAIRISGGDGTAVCRLLELPPSVWGLLLKPWTAVTYMFTHYDLLHFIFNMLWLYCFGIIFLDHYRNRDFVAAYLLGGLAGAAFYLAGCAMLPHVSSSGLLGSSAAVLSVAAATVVRSPNYRIRLFLLGMVKIKWVAAAFVVFALLSSDLHSPGSQLAHAGGIICGVVFALNARYGKKILRIRKQYHKPGGKKRGDMLPPLHTKPVGGQQTATGKELEARLDELLDRVRLSGYESLTAAEKQELIELSKKIKL